MFFYLPDVFFSPFKKFLLPNFSKCKYIKKHAVENHIDVWYCYRSSIMIVLHLHDDVLPLLLHKLGVKTGSSRLGTDERGKCDNVRLSAACLSNEATICSMVVVVAWAKADRVRDRDRGWEGTERTRDRDTGSILVDYQTEGLETSVWLLILRAERETYWDRL